MFYFTGILEVSLNVLDLSSFIIYISNALLGSIWIILIVKVYELIFMIISKRVDFYGKASRIIMETHQIVMLLLRIPIKENYCWNLIYCAIVLIVELPIIIILNKVKCRRRK